MTCKISKSQPLRFITKVNPNNENETKSDIFPWYIFKPDVISLLSEKKYYNDFQNQNF